MAQAVSETFRRQQVYIISRSDGAIKIGISVRPKIRRAGLQMSCPEKLTLEKTYRPKNKTAAAVEAEFKSLLSPLKIRGEWFKFSALTEFAEIVVEAIIEDCPIKRAFVDRIIEDELAPDEGSYARSQLLKAGWPELYWRCQFEL